jgi:hypothetical protein
MAKNDIKSQLGFFVRTAWQQLDTVREVVVRQGKAGRIQLDLTLMRRRRNQTLAELGAVVARLAENGKLSEDDFPELSAPLSKLEALDERIAQEERRARATAAGVPVPEEPEDEVAAYPAGDAEEYDDEGAYEGDEGGDEDDDDERGA